MRHRVVIWLFVSGILLSVFGYSAAWIDWVQDYRTGMYASHPLEAILETSAIALYTFLGARFIFSRIRFF
ncbi:hypothetical protein [Spirosoma sp. KNUC1025]|uniref:hypothetical protein n=1 Tax=Spirosoma sp. KNUC1025 TaxID=2894082 RepID=UPI00386796F4|nr:hypothetical protein LN737_19415 [Spirosoma sp. KNUC1025]UFH54681.1 hypothetical protein LN737_00555 [Spirosoma sp. KNUC1025]